MILHNPSSVCQQTALQKFLKVTPNPVGLVSMELEHELFYEAVT